MVNDLELTELLILSILSSGHIFISSFKRISDNCENHIEQEEGADDDDQDAEDDGDPGLGSVL